MGFKENLKIQLQFSDMLVKELAERTGVKKTTLDSYLRVNGYTPSVEAGVKIAQALGVSVEYLVTGEENSVANLQTSNSPIAKLVAIVKELPESDRYRLLEIAKVIQRTSRPQ